MEIISKRMEGCSNLPDMFSLLKLNAAEMSPFINLKIFNHKLPGTVIGVLWSLFGKKLN
jgi:hypothetical protein